jgi:hypothetical protein
MRVAALYDIHGNVPALDAVLAEVEREQVDLIVIGGDVVAGPQPGASPARSATCSPASNRPSSSTSMSSGRSCSVMARRGAIRR